MLNILISELYKWRDIAFMEYTFPVLRLASGEMCLI